MQQQMALWPDPVSHLTRQQPDHPVLYLSPEVLFQTVQQFQTGFDGLVTYAVKANDRAEVLANLVAAGIEAFDVASPHEMRAVRAIYPQAQLHYNNPVRSRDEIAQARAFGITSWSVDDLAELEKLGDIPRTCEIAVRFALPVQGAAYDFGDKFGAPPAQAVELLQKVAQMGFTPALCFHPGTQCDDPHAWVQYIEAAADIAAQAQVRIARLNVGGGFASHRTGARPDLPAIFDAIQHATRAAFGANAPTLICEPGRAMVAEAFTLAARIKAVRADGTLFLNDGIYSGMTDLRDMGLMDRVAVVAPDGTPRRAPRSPRRVFGPTCDSLDRLPDGMPVPDDTQEGDYILMPGMGAYSIAMSTQFNGYGLRDVVTVRTA